MNLQAPPSGPQPPSNLELFVCQRVSAELQPMLEGWKDAVRAELLQVREASADAGDWREAVSSELADLRVEQQRAAASLEATTARLAEAPRRSGRRGESCAAWKRVQKKARQENADPKKVVRSVPA